MCVCVVCDLGGREIRRYGRTLVVEVCCTSLHMCGAVTMDPPLGQPVCVCYG